MGIITQEQGIYRGVCLQDQGVQNNRWDTAVVVPLSKEHYFSISNIKQNVQSFSAGMLYE